VGGETWFDGIINPECQLGACGQGTLNIGSGGALFLRHDGAGSDGPSAAFVEQLNIASDGTLIFELPVGADPEASYPQIMAEVANLDGTLLVGPLRRLLPVRRRNRCKRSQRPVRQLRNRGQSSSARAELRL
jgi:hypothetical protein